MTRTEYNQRVITRKKRSILIINIVAHDIHFMALLNQCETLTMRPFTGFDFGPHYTKCGRDHNGF